MKAGDPFFCQKCREKSVVKAKTKMDGWKAAGTVPVCALCGAELSEEPAAEESDGSGSKKKALLAFLGETDAPPQKSPERENVHFCRDCKHRIVNAFRIFCGKHSKDVNFMDDCPDWESRPDQQN